MSLLNLEVYFKENMVYLPNYGKHIALPSQVLEQLGTQVLEHLEKPIKTVGFVTLDSILLGLVCSIICIAVSVSLKVPEYITYLLALFLGFGVCASISELHRNSCERAYILAILGCELVLPDLIIEIAIEIDQRKLSYVSDLDFWQCCSLSVKEALSGEQTLALSILDQWNGRLTPIPLDLMRLMILRLDDEDVDECCSVIQRLEEANWQNWCTTPQLWFIASRYSAEQGQLPKVVDMLEQLRNRWKYSPFQAKDLNLFFAFFGQFRELPQSDGELHQLDPAIKAYYCAIAKAAADNADYARSLLEQSLKLLPVVYDKNKPLARSVRSLEKLIRRRLQYIHETQMVAEKYASELQRLQNLYEQWQCINTDSQRLHSSQTCGAWWTIN